MTSLKVLEFAQRTLASLLVVAQLCLPWAGLRAEVATHSDDPVLSESRSAACFKNFGAQDKAFLESLRHFSLGTPDPKQKGELTELSELEVANFLKRLEDYSKTGNMAHGISANVLSLAIENAERQVLLAMMSCTQTPKTACVNDEQWRALTKLNTASMPKDKAAFARDVEANKKNFATTAGLLSKGFDDVQNKLGLKYHAPSGSWRGKITQQSKQQLTPDAKNTLQALFGRSIVDEIENPGSSEVGQRGSSGRVEAARSGNLVIVPPRGKDSVMEVYDDKGYAQEVAASQKDFLNKAEALVKKIEAVNDRTLYASQAELEDMSKALDALSSNYVELRRLGLPEESITQIKNAVTQYQQSTRDAFTRTDKKIEVLEDLTTEAAKTLAVIAATMATAGVAAEVMGPVTIARWSSIGARLARAPRMARFAALPGMRALQASRAAQAMAPYMLQASGSALSFFGVQMAFTGVGIGVATAGETTFGADFWCSLSANAIEQSRDAFKAAPEMMLKFGALPGAAGALTTGVSRLALLRKGMSGADAVSAAYRATQHGKKTMQALELARGAYFTGNGVRDGVVGYGDCRDAYAQAEKHNTDEAWAAVAKACGQALVGVGSNLYFARHDFTDMRAKIKSLAKPIPQQAVRNVDFNSYDHLARKRAYEAERENLVKDGVLDESALQMMMQSRMAKLLAKHGKEGKVADDMWFMDTYMQESAALHAALGNVRRSLSGAEQDLAVLTDAKQSNQRVALDPRDIPNADSLRDQLDLSQDRILAVQRGDETLYVRVQDKGGRISMSYVGADGTPLTTRGTPTTAIFKGAKIWTASHGLGNAPLAKRATASANDFFKIAAPTGDLASVSPDYVNQIARNGETYGPQAMRDYSDFMSNMRRVALSDAHNNPKLGKTIKDSVAEKAAEHKKKTGKDVTPEQQSQFFTEEVLARLLEDNPTTKSMSKDDRDALVEDLRACKFIR